MSATTYYAEYSNTDGEMWVNAGQFSKIGQARQALRPFAKAGNLTRIVAVEADAPLGTVRQLVKIGKAKIAS